MAYPLINSVDTTQGIQTIFIYLNEITNFAFMNGVVLLIFAVLCLGSFFAKKQADGNGDFPACFAVSSYIMIPFVVILGMIPGLINGFIVIQMIVLATMGTLWLYFSRRPSY